MGPAIWGSVVIIRDRTAANTFWGKSSELPTLHQLYSSWGRALSGTAWSVFSVVKLKMVPRGTFSNFVLQSFKT